jgi:Protein of unknown function (DUF4239)
VNVGVIGMIAFACIFGAALLGMRLRAALPEHQLSAETKDSVRLGMGLVATMAALLLGLLVASAKSSYDTQKSEVTQMAAKLVFLDRVLAHYGPEATETRELLRRATERVIDHMWPDKGFQQAQVDPSASPADVLYDSIQKLSPKDDVQRALKSQALGIAVDLGQARWLLFEQGGSSISTPMLVVVLFWLAIIFLSFGLFAPSNKIVIATLFLAALSVSGAIFLILELDRPFGGLIQIPSEPMRKALSHLGR